MDLESFLIFLENGHWGFQYYFNPGFIAQRLMQQPLKLLIEGSNPSRPTRTVFGDVWTGTAMFYMKNIWAIGDLHGHYDQLLRLYDKILQNGFSPEDDILVFLGDYVDGGSQVKQIIDWLIEHKKKYPHWQMLYGNHESLLLDALVYNGRIYGSYDLWWGQGGRETTQSYISFDLTDYERALVGPKDAIPVEHLEFLMSLPYYYESENYFFVHAGIPNKMSLSDLKQKLDDRDEKMMYESIWIREPFLMNVKDWGRKIVFGHTIFPYGSFLGVDPETGKKTHKGGFPLIQKNKIGLDGMKHNMGNLICVKLPEEVFFFENSQI